MNADQKHVLGQVGQILMYARTLENVLEEYSGDPTRLMEMAKKAQEFIRKGIFARIGGSEHYVVLELDHR